MSVAILGKKLNNYVVLYESGLQILTAPEADYGFNLGFMKISVDTLDLLDTL